MVRLRVSYSKRRNSESKLAHVHEQRELTHSGSSVAAGHLEPNASPNSRFEPELSRGGKSKGVRKVYYKERKQREEGGLRPKHRTLHVEYAERRIQYGILFISIARFMNTVKLNMNMFLSSTGFTARNTLFIFLWLRSRNT